MCLGIPGKILKIDENQMAEVEMGGVVRQAGLQIVPEAKVGDYVIVHAGFAIEILDETEAEERLKLFEQMAEGMEPDMEQEPA